MAPPRDVEVEGVTTFHPPSTSYRYILNLKDNKLSIWMEDKTTKQQWFKADVAQGDYIPANAITDTSALDFVKLFQLALDCELGKCDDVQRKVDFYQCGALRLTFTVQFQLRRSVGATKYTFKLDPFSIEHIDELESKLRDQQEELDQLRSAHRVLPFVQFEASTKNATTGKLLWKSVESDIFHVIDAEVLIRRPGRYSVAAVVNSAKQNDYAGLRKNKTCDFSEYHPFCTFWRKVFSMSQFLSASIPFLPVKGFSAKFPFCNMEPSQRVEAKGVIFQPPLPTSFRYVLQLKDDKLSISMEDNTSKKQWSKSDMVKEDYVTLANSVIDGSALDYLKDALDCDMDKCGNVERQLELVQGGALRLSFAIQFRFLRSTRVAKYTFELNPVAGQIQVLESKLRSYEEELERLRNAGRAFPFARFEASTTHPHTQKLLWNAVESDIFHVVDGTVTIRQKGAYTVAVWFYTNPRKAALLKNKIVQEIARHH